MNDSQKKFGVEQVTGRSLCRTFDFLSLLPPLIQLHRCRLLDFADFSSDSLFLFPKVPLSGQCSEHSSGDSGRGIFWAPSINAICASRPWGSGNEISLLDADVVTRLKKASSSSVSSGACAFEDFKVRAFAFT